MMILLTVSYRPRTPGSYGCSIDYDLRHNQFTGCLCYRNERQLTPLGYAFMAIIIIIVLATMFAIAVLFQACFKKCQNKK